MPKKKLTDEIYGQIPALVEQGGTKDEIAAKFGVKTGTLIVQCSRRGISLRKGPRRQPRQRIAIERQPVIAEAAQIVSLRLEAKARGMMTELDLVSQLLDIIVKDKLYDAILGTRDELLDA